MGLYDFLQPILGAIHKTLEWLIDTVHDKNNQTIFQTLDTISHHYLRAEELNFKQIQYNCTILFSKCPEKQFFLANANDLPPPLGDNVFRHIGTLSGQIAMEQGTGAFWTPGVTGTTPSPASVTSMPPLGEIGTIQSMNESDTSEIYDAYESSGDILTDDSDADSTYSLD